MRRVGKIFKTCIALLLSLAMCVPDLAYMGTVQMVEANETDALDDTTETEEPTETETPDITRVEWIKELVELFDMTVEEDNYPDNYFSDISAEDDDYRTVMVAAEFGLIDVEAGEAFEPDEPATREFAVHTLNFCLGFELEDDTYTFSDSADTDYPADAQVGINRGWVALVDGEFAPETALTESEEETMLADAEAVLETTTIDDSYINTFTFVDGVVEIPAGTDAEILDDGTLQVTDSDVAIQEGDTFVVYFMDLPSAYKATAVTTTDNIQTITAEEQELEPLLKTVDAEGEQDIDLSQIELLDDDATVTYITGGTAAAGYRDGEEIESYALAGNKTINAINFSKKISVGTGLTASISCVIPSPTIKYRLKTNDIYMAMSGDANISCSLNANFLEGTGIPSSLPIFHVNIAGFGEFTIDLTYKFSGSVTFNSDVYFSAGLQYTSKGGFRLNTNFQKKRFTIVTELTFSAGIRAELSTIDLKIFKASLYAEAGGITKLSSETFTDGKKPTTCRDICSWLYAKVGASATVKLGVTKSWSESKDIYTVKNSPVRVCNHFEDDTLVPYCTRDLTGRKYYTSYNSPYGGTYSGYGLDEDGELVPVFTYELDDDDNAIVTGYTADVSALYIPSELDGHTVVKIADSAFADRTNLRIVTIPDSVTEIGAYAFNYCTNLSLVTLSKSVTVIGRCAFGTCNSLTSIEIPKSLEETGTWTTSQDGVFNGCENLKNVTFEEGTTEIANALFMNCPGLETITIPDTVTTIERSAFENCTNLTSITIPAAVTTIEGSAFSNCTNMGSAEISDGVTYIGEYAFYNCENLSSVTLSKSLVTMGYKAFGNCDSLTNIEIPKSLTDVTDFWGKSENGVFNGCDNLKNVTFEEGTTKVSRYLFAHCLGLETITIPDTVTVIEEGAFLDCEKLSSVKLSKSVTTIGGAAFYGCDALTSIEIPKSLTSTTEILYEENFPYLDRIHGPFAYCSNLKNVTFEEGTTKIVDYLFANCTGLETITVPDTVETIGNDAFINCTNLMSATIPNSVTVIGEYVFYDCTSLTSVTIPNTVSEIREATFKECTNLTGITIPDSVTEIGGSAFEGCASLEKISLPDSITSMGTYIFYGCTSLKEAKLPNTRVDIMQSTFEGCTSLESIELPETVQYIRTYAFKNCTSLKNITWSPNLTEIEKEAFYNCDALTSVTLPDSVTTMGNYAFADCDAMTSITIPDSVTSMGKYIFYDCDLLTDVNLGIGLTTIPESAFEHCDVLASIVLPYRITTVGENAFKDCVALKEITIPRGTSSIADTAFSYPTKMTAYGVSGTYAEEYANAKGMTFVEKLVPVTSLSFDVTELSVYDGKTAKLSLSILPTNFTDEIVWKVTDESVLSVTDLGVVTAKKVGTATIKVTAGDCSASVKVTVLQPVTSVSLNKMSLTLDGAAQYQLTASASPSTAVNKEIAWSSSDEKVATVDENGLVTAVSKGTAKITATAADGNGAYRTCTVTVSNNAYVVTDVADLQSTHPYTNDNGDIWLYTVADAESLSVTFDEATEMEEDFDYLYVYDKNGKQIGKYTGKALAGQTLAITGDTVKIRLSTDNAGTAYGFKVSKVEANATATPEVTATPNTTETPSADPSVAPTEASSARPTETSVPTATPEVTPTPSAEPTATSEVTATPSATSTAAPSATPTAAPTAEPTATPSVKPMETPPVTATPNTAPTETTTAAPTAEPSTTPTVTPSTEPVATPTVLPTPNPNPVSVRYGDVNEDTYVNVSDALLVLRNVVGLTELTESQTIAADVDGTEGIKVGDALCILRKVVNLIDEFPVEEQ